MKQTKMKTENHQKSKAETEHRTGKMRDEKEEFIHPFPEDQEQNDRLNQLIADVREAFQRNQFAIPGDIDLQVRGMAMLLPHHAPVPETQLGPGVVQPATEEAGIR